MSALVNGQHEPQFPNSEGVRQARRFLKRFRHCRFGKRCYNSHKLSMDSGQPSQPSKGPVVQVPAQASVQQAKDECNIQASTPKHATPVCHFFKRGTCRFGANCRDSHDLSVGPENPGEPPEKRKETSGRHRTIKRYTEQVWGGGGGSRGASNGFSGGRGGGTEQGVDLDLGGRKRDG